MNSATTVTGDNRNAEPGTPPTPFELLNILLARWKLVALPPLAVSFVAAVIVLVIAPTYTSVTAFRPEVQSPSRIPSGLASLAGQFGLSLGTEAAQSAEFYLAVLRSPSLVNTVLLSEFAKPRAAAGDSATLLQIIDVDGDSLLDSLHNGRRKMKGLVAVSHDKPSNILTVAVTLKDPVLAAAVANRFVSALNEFNTRSRQSQSSELRRFTQARLHEADSALAQAENAMRLFLERNRTWQQSPQLGFERDRLQRQIESTQEIDLTLRREYEAARIDEVNDTPVITVVYQATPPQEKAAPHRKLVVIMAFAVTAMASVFAALLAEYLRRLRERDQVNFSNSKTLFSAMRSDLSRLIPRARH